MFPSTAPGQRERRLSARTCLSARTLTSAQLSTPAATSINNHLQPAQDDITDQRLRNQFLPTQLAHRLSRQHNPTPIRNEQTSLQGDDCDMNLNDNPESEEVMTNVEAPTPLDMTAAIANDSRQRASSSQRLRSQKVIVKQLRKGIRLVVPWTRMVSFLAINGKTHFTTSQYEFMAGVVKNASGGDLQLCTYKTARRSQKNFMTQHCFPLSILYYIHTNYQRANRRHTICYSNTVNKQKQDSRDCARIVYPSEWALLDVVCLPTFSLLFNTDTSAFRGDLSIEDAPIVNCDNRDEFLSGTSCLWSSFKNTIVPLYPGEQILFHCKNCKIFDADFHNADTTTHVNTTNHCSVNGTISKIWCVRSSSVSDRSTSPAISKDHFLSITADMSLQELCLFYCTYTSTHSIKSLCQASTTESSEEEPSYEKLFTIPGDICSFIRPTAIASITVQPKYICLFIASFLWREGGRIGERIVWINTEVVKEYCKKVLYQQSQLYDQRSQQQHIDDHTFHSHLQNYENISETFTIMHHCAKNIPIAAWAAVSAIPTFPEAIAPKSCSPLTTARKNHGTLSDGTPYYIYRFILYTDGFNQKKSLSDQRSVCGCYIMPAGLPQYCRCSSSSARVLTLGAHGQDPNELMECVVDDIAKGTVDGIEGFDPYGKKVKIFLDAIAIIGDYPAVTSGTDLSGHNSDSFCSFCTITKRKGGNHTQILYTSDLHSRRASLTRFDERMKAVRSEGTNPLIRKHLGTSCETEDQASSRIAIHLSNSLRSHQHKSITDINGHQINNCSFDSHLSGAACPDHLFKGLISNVLTVCFNRLPDDDIRRHVDILVCSSIRSHKLPSIDTIVNWDKSGKYNGMTNLNTSALFCTLLFAAPVFKLMHNFLQKQSHMESTSNSGCDRSMSETIGTDIQESSSAAIATPRINHTSTSDASNIMGNTLYNCNSAKNKTPAPFHLPHLLQEVISLVFWWPKPSTSTNSEVSYIQGSRGDRSTQLKYFADVQMRCKRYTESINQYCVRGGEWANLLDKPNAHRLLEFAYHTLPMYGHALNVSELVLEQVHRNFKDWLEKNVNDNAHLTAVEIALSRDWGMRAFALYKLWEGGTDDEKKSAEFGLRRLFLGQSSMHADRNLPYVNLELEKFHSMINQAFGSPVEEQLRGNRTFPLLPTESECWIVEQCFGEPETRQYVDAIASLKDYIKCTTTTEEVNLKFYAIAKHIRKGRFQQSHPTNPVNNIHIGDFISAIVDNQSDTFIIPSSSSQRKAFFVVLHITLHQSDVGPDTIWLMVKQLITQRVGGLQCCDRSTTIQWVQMNLSMRKEGKLHACTENCITSLVGSQMVVSHDDSDNWILLSAAHGFPPHMA